MGLSLTKKQRIFYFNPKETYSIYEFCTTLTNLIKKKATQNQEIVLVCIGSDRATGDCLGPIVGYKLSRYKSSSFTVYGTLEDPVHAKNLTSTLEEISRNHHNPVIIAIDASLGTNKHLGFITLGEGSLNPGVGVDKELPCVGDIFITGIVNISGMLNQILLQTTRLNVVMKLADFICLGIRYSMYEVKGKIDKET